MSGTNYAPVTARGGVAFAGTVETESTRIPISLPVCWSCQSHHSHQRGLSKEQKTKQDWG